MKIKLLPLFCPLPEWATPLLLCVIPVSVSLPQAVERGEQPMFCWSDDLLAWQKRKLSRVSGLFFLEDHKGHSERFQRKNEAAAIPERPILGLRVSTLAHMLTHTLTHTDTHSAIPCSPMHHCTWVNQCPGGPLKMRCFLKGGDGFCAGSPCPFLKSTALLLKCTGLTRGGSAKQTPRPTDHPGRQSILSLWGGEWRRWRAHQWVSFRC